MTSWIALAVIAAAPPPPGAAGAGAGDACLAEQAHYRLKADADYTAALVPALHHASEVSRLYLRVSSPERSWWFVFGATQGYGGLFLEPVSDPTLAEAKESGPRPLSRSEERPLQVFPMSRKLDVLDVAPQTGQPAPDALFIPQLGPALWYSPSALSGDPDAKAENMPRSVFVRVGCGPEIGPAYP